MRNPIQPSPDRPIPLPDCILMDAWWADRRDELRERPVELRLVHVEREEGPNDRYHRGEHRPG
jgi:hypothetical protein